MSDILNQRIRQLEAEIQCPRIPITEQTSIKSFGNFSDAAAGPSLQNAFDDSMSLTHKLPEWVVLLSGMSGRKYRYLINNLIGRLRSPRYLEVGSFAGSTACSAMYGNSVEMICIDNWSQFGGPRDLFMHNVRRTMNTNSKIAVVEADFRSVDFHAFNDVMVYMFDGPHAEQDQYDGVALALPALAKEFVLIVDDWNFTEVRNGTHRALQDRNLTILCGFEIFTTTNNTHPIVQWQNSDWHNGYYIAAIRK